MNFLCCCFSLGRRRSPEAESAGRVAAGEEVARRVERVDRVHRVEKLALQFLNRSLARGVKDLHSSRVLHASDHEAALVFRVLNTTPRQM